MAGDDRPATAALVSLVEFEHKAGIGRGEIISIVLGLIIGSISFTGSIVAFAKLQELISGRAIRLPSQRLIQIGLGLAGLVVAGPDDRCDDFHANRNVNRAMQFPAGVRACRSCHALLRCARLIVAWVVDRVLAAFRVRHLFSPFTGA